MLVSMEQLEPVKALVAHHKLPNITWHIAMNNHASTRPKCYGGKLCESVSKCKTYNRVQTPGSASVDTMLQARRATVETAIVTVQPNVAIQQAPAGSLVDPLAPGSASAAGVAAATLDATAPPELQRARWRRRRL